MAETHGAFEAKLGGRALGRLGVLTPIPGIGSLSEGQKDARLRENFQPYHDRIKAAMAGGPAGGIGRDAKFYAGLHGLGAALACWRALQCDARFADALIAWLNGEEGLIVGDNEPYSMTDKSDYTISAPGERGLLHVEVEIRQDLIAGESGQRAWGALHARLLPHAYQEAWSSRAVLRWAMNKDRLTPKPRNGPGH